MPRILIAGCGYVGQATATLFQESGWKVEGWTLSPESAHKLAATVSFPVRAVDLTERGQVRAAASDFDRIIHCASSRGGDATEYRRIYLEGARNLLNVFPGSRLLFTSSTSVYAQKDGAWISELDPAEPTRETGKVLRETEELVLGGGIVARVAGIYGPGRSFLLQRFLSGEAVIDRQRDHFINQVHRDDIASALLILSERDATGIYNVVDDQPILISECYRWLAGELHRPEPREDVERGPRKRGESNKRVSNRKLRALGWAPRYPTFAEAMRKSILPAQKDQTVGLF